MLSIELNQAACFLWLFELRDEVLRPEELPDDELWLDDPRLPECSSSVGWMSLLKLLVSPSAVFS